MNTLPVFALVLSIASAIAAVRDLNTPWTFPNVGSKGDWQKRAEEIREHVQFSCGLWPPPPKTPLNAKVFDRIEREGYSVEKVYFETYPGFYLGGNLYRPLGKGDGPFPAVLNPHGHWANGRMADTDLGSIAARCINFARQGMVAFTYDMVGYNDTKQVPDHRKFATDPASQLWNISLMGLQTWNSIRALDFLESLSDVDRERLACTGESGGGTQTFILGAIDERLAVQAPIVMVSHSMQGGCLCENAPGLRVDYSNMEIAAAPAPRPQIIVAATGDWTKKTMSVEGPGIESVYNLFGATDRFDYAIFDYEHNYNKTTREEVYQFFSKWLLKEENSELKEQPYKKEPDADLRVFPDDKYPEGALTDEQVIPSMVEVWRKQLQELRPTNPGSLNKWKRTMRPAWEHALQLQHIHAAKRASDNFGTSVRLERSPGETEVELQILKPRESMRKAVVIVPATDQGSREFAEGLREKGITAVTVRLPERKDYPDQFKNFYNTYNRTWLQDRVADLKAAIDYVKEQFPGAPILVVGRGSDGLASVAVAPIVSGVAADCAELGDSSDQTLLDPKVFFPGIRRIGSFQGIAALGAPNPLFLHNTGGKLEVDWLPPLYRNANASRFSQAEQRATDEELMDWVLRFAAR
jgi:dienelactone hydrolase